MTRAERTAIRREAKLRVRMAFAATEQLTGDPALWRKITRLLLTLSTRELLRLRKWKR
jgi:hypothetical protein